MDCQTKPETVDLERCRQCKSASAQLLWCCRHGFYLQPTKGQAAIRNSDQKVFKAEAKIVSSHEQIPEDWKPPHWQCVDKKCPYLKQPCGVCLILTRQINLQKWFREGNNCPLENQFGLNPSTTENGI